MCLFGTYFLDNVCSGVSYFPVTLLIQIFSNVLIILVAVFIIEHLFK